MVSRGLSVIWIAVTLVVQVFALTALFDAWQVFDTAWRYPFADLGRYYAIIITLISDYIGGPLEGTVGETVVGRRIALPCWWVHGLAMYGAASSAIWAGSLSRDERDERVSEIKRGGFSIAWPLAVAGLLTQGVRNQAVTSFARQNSGTAVFYGLAALALYAGANWANIHMLSGPPAPGQEIALVNAVPCPVVNTDGVIRSIGEYIPAELRDVIDPPSEQR